MRIHREGRATIGLVIALIVGAALLTYFVVKFFAILVVALVVLLLFVMYFFRRSKRSANHDGRTICSPCDGRVVAVERVAEPEIFGGQERLQISVFMSVWSVHINWYPCVGTVSYAKHHKGKYLVAWLPKSSTDNERSSVVIDHPSGERILMRQVAGAVARRIVTYATPGVQAAMGEEMGFIKFGSRVDLYLPTNAEVHVAVGDRVQGVTTALASIK